MLQIFSKTGICKVVFEFPEFFFHFKKTIIVYPQQVTLMAKVFLPFMYIFMKCKW